MNKIKAIVKRPDEVKGHVTSVSNTLENLQTHVGGYIEVFRGGPNWAIICNEEGKLLGLPAEMLDRHPFPGPSLGVRHVGAIKRETLAMLREADAIVTEELYASGWYHKTWQTFAIFVPVKTVGIRNGCRSYDYVIAIRSINSVDAVTAQVVHLPWELLEKMSDRIVHEVEGVNRVVYDITAKPPGTIEWE